METADLLAVIFAVVALGVAVTCAVLAVRLASAVRSLNDAARAFQEEAIPAVTELRTAVRRATQQVDRVDDLVDVATAIGDRVDAATDATYRALTSPVIKGVAIASGTRRAARRLRRAD
ncbi:MAG: hypothetical protein ACKOYM_11265 [Actinomycetes bacterium]